MHTEETAALHLFVRCSFRAPDLCSHYSFACNALLAHLRTSFITDPAKLQQITVPPYKAFSELSAVDLLSHNNILKLLLCNSSLQLGWYPWGSSVTDSSLQLMKYLLRGFGPVCN